MYKAQNLPQFACHIQRYSGTGEHAFLENPEKQTPDPNTGPCCEYSHRQQNISSTVKNALEIAERNVIHLAYQVLTAANIIFHISPL